MAGTTVFALLVHDRPHPLESLKAELRNCSVETWSVKSLDDTARLLDQTLPELVFTDTQLVEGTWSDVVSLAEKAGAPANVIVVGSSADAKAYAKVMQGGTFDYLFPPFAGYSLALCMMPAAEDVRLRRHAQALRAVA